MKKQPLKSMMHGAFVLTIAAFIAKILSAVYRVPLQNLVGDEGFYVYQQVYPLYGIAMTLALTGLPQFIAKYVAEQEATPNQSMQLQQLASFVTRLSLLLWALIFFFSQPIATLMGDGALGPSIRVASLTFLLIPPLAMYRGWLQGNLILVPTAISQVAEQFIRVGIILVAAMSFRRLDWNIYQVSQVAMIGSFIGGIVACVILFRYYRQANPKQTNHMSALFIQKTEKTWRRRFFIEGGFVSIYSGYLILLQLIDSFLLVNILEKSGLSPLDARIEKGVFDRGQPLVQLGLVVALALGTSFVPMLTRYLKEKNTSEFLFSARLYLRLTTTIGLAASVGLALVMPYMNYTLFKDRAGNDVLRVFVFSVGLMAIVHGYQSIAQSQNHFRKALKAAAFGLLAKLIFTPLLVYFLGTMGASLAMLLALSVALMALVQQEQPGINAFWREDYFGLRLFLALAVMSMSILLVYGGLTFFFGGVLHRRTALLRTLVGVFVGIVSFGLSLVYLKVFTIEEWAVIPFGKKIVQKVGRKHET